MEDFCKVTEYEQKEDGCLVTFNNSEQLFFSYDEFYKYSLYDKDEYLGMSLEALMNSVYTDRAYHEGVKESLKSRKTSGEIYRLLKKKYPEDVCDEAVRVLAEEQYIDDAKYALGFVKKYADKLYSKNYILKQGESKGLPEHEIIKAFEILETDDKENAGKAFAKKEKELESEKDILKKKRKIISFLSSKGYDFDTINGIINMKEDQGDD